MEHPAQRVSLLGHLSAPNAVVDVLVSVVVWEVPVPMVAEMDLPQENLARHASQLEHPLVVHLVADFVTVIALEVPVGSVVGMVATADILPPSNAAVYCMGLESFTLWSPPSKRLFDYGSGYS